MKIQPECIPCLIKRILFESELSTKEKKRQTAALRNACLILAETYNPKTCSATIATQVHKNVYDTLQHHDRYKRLKQLSNSVATSLVPKVEHLITTSSDPLKTSIQCAIIGNIMDFGIDGASIHPQSLADVFDRFYAEGLGYDDYKTLRTLVKNASHILLFTDNCGEIVFDKILCRELKHLNPMLHITAVVKGEPILSDATASDAKTIALHEVVDEIVTTGCFAVGVDFLKLPAPVKKTLKHTDLIISKGMANYESFSETANRPIAYLLRTKCHAIAQSMNLPQNISVIKVYR